ncbi:hypothetical protein GQ44DRAFT_707918 [Phaeosphaeriaceae sp. PMI808]|nr:hypothetical protein GQ44DRAFT_707918 [Phaeosphaeriaceae sp. PMI808]
MLARLPIVSMAPSVSGPEAYPCFIAIVDIFRTTIVAGVSSQCGPLATHNRPIGVIL